jgi:hypothetical protein
MVRLTASLATKARRSSVYHSKPWRPARLAELAWLTPFFLAVTDAPQAGHRPHVGVDLAVHVDDDDQLLAVGPADGDLLDGGVGGAGEGVQLLDARQLAGDADLGPRLLERVEAAALGVVVGDGGDLPGAVGDARRGAGRAEHGLEREVLGEGVAGLVADDDAQADALVDGGGRAADDAVLHGDAVVAAVLEVEVSRVGAAGGELGHHAGDGGLVDREEAEVFGEVGLVAGDHGGGGAAIAAAEQSWASDAEQGDAGGRAAHECAAGGDEGVHLVVSLPVTRGSREASAWWLGAPWRP